MKVMMGTMERKVLGKEETRLIFRQIMTDMVNGYIGSLDEGGHDPNIMGMMYEFQRAMAENDIFINSSHITVRRMGYIDEYEQELNASAETYNLDLEKVEKKVSELKAQGLSSSEISKILIEENKVNNAFIKADNNTL